MPRKASENKRRSEAAGTASTSPPSPAGDFPVLLRVKEAAAILSLSVCTVYDLVRAGRIEAFRLTPKGDGIRIDRAALMLYLESCRVGPAAETERNPDAIYIGKDEIRRAERRRKKAMESALGEEIVHLKDYLPEAWGKLGLPASTQRKAN